MAEAASSSADLARLLWQARRDGGIVRPDDAAQPESLAAAYAVQRAIVAFSGAPSRGFKVGSTSLEAQRALGTDQPGSGPLLAPFVYESPARLAIEPAHTPAVEGEFAYRLGRDLPQRATPYTIDEVADAVAAVAGAIEVVGTRFSGGLAGKGRLLVTADCGANIAFVGGPWRHDLRSMDLKVRPVAMMINRALRGSGTGARALGDPMNVLLWLANQQSAEGRGLKSGEIVSTVPAQASIRFGPAIAFRLISAILERLKSCSNDRLAFGYRESSFRRPHACCCSSALSPGC